MAGVTGEIIEALQARGFFYHLEPYTHRYPHCWRCGTALVFRVVDEWYISMGPVYDVPRALVSPEQKAASLRYQIMDVVDRIRWIPGFGYERELDWLHTMSDWMISKKRYWGLALPIWECGTCEAFEVVGGREELGERAVAWVRGTRGTDAASTVGRRGRPRLPCAAAARCAASRTSATPGSTPASSRSARSTIGRDPEHWQKWFPADFITESFPGQFRNWFYSMLAMGTVLRSEPPFLTIFGYATLFGEDGRPMHKSWGNAIEFNEAAERMGVDVMRWMYSRQKPEDNILFGYHTADEARRELLVLWNVLAFFSTYARLTGWQPARATVGAQTPDPGRSLLDRWIVSRAAATAAAAEARLADYDTRAAALTMSTFIDDLSTWWLRRSRRRLSRSDDTRDREAAFGALHLSLAALGASAGAAPTVPRRGDPPGARRAGRAGRARLRALDALADERSRAAARRAGSRRR